MQLTSEASPIYGYSPELHIDMVGRSTFFGLLQVFLVQGDRFSVKVLFQRLAGHLQECWSEIGMSSTTSVFRPFETPGPRIMSGTWMSVSCPQPLPGGILCCPM